MKRQKTQKGITLVALIITIVVLLILAIVSIGAVRDSKIITHAQNAGSSYTIAQEKEQIGLAVSEYQIQKAISADKPSFYEVVKAELDGTAEVTDNGDGTLTVTFKKTGNVYILESNGTITPVVKEENTNNPEEPEEVVTVGVKAYQAGDYIYLITPENEMFTFTNENILEIIGPQELFLTNASDGINGYTVTFSEDFTSEEKSKLQLLYRTDLGLYFVLSEDRNTVYNLVIGSDNSATITKDVLATNDDTLVAQCYHNSTEYEYYYTTNFSYTWDSGGNSYTDCVFYINYEENNAEVRAVMVNNLNVEKIIYDSTISSTEILVNDVIFEIKTNSMGTATENVTIRAGAKKINLSDGEVAYIQDDNLYILNGCLTLTRYINSAAFPTE